MEREAMHGIFDEVEQRRAQDDLHRRKPRYADEPGDDQRGGPDGQQRDRAMAEKDHQHG
jgi:hypothetical protein